MLRQPMPYKQKDKISSLWNRRNYKMPGDKERNAQDEIICCRKLFRYFLIMDNQGRQNTRIVQ